MVKTALKINDYFATLADEDQVVLKTLADMIIAIDPNLSQSIWEGVFWGGSNQSILAFGDIVMVNSKKEEIKWFLLGLARQKNYYSIYVNTYKDKKHILKSYPDSLGKVKLGSGSIGFKKLEDLNLDSLKQLFIESITLYDEERKHK